MNVKKLLLVCYLLMTGWLTQSQNVNPYAAAVWMSGNSLPNGTNFYNAHSEDEGGFSADGFSLSPGYVF